MILGVLVTDDWLVIQKIEYSSRWLSPKSSSFLPYGLFPVAGFLVTVWITRWIVGWCLFPWRIQRLSRSLSRFGAQDIKTQLTNPAKREESRSCNVETLTMKRLINWCHNSWTSTRQLFPLEDNRFRLECKRQTNLQGWRKPELRFVKPLPRTKET